MYSFSRFFQGLFTLAIFQFLISGCSTEPAEANLTLTLEERSFSINTPEGWKILPAQGYDTYVGKITNGDIIIYFDQGFLAFKDLESITRTESTIFLEELTINGVPAKLHKESLPGDASHKTRLSVYIGRENTQKNRLYVMDPQNEQLIRAIFKSHKFLEPSED